MKKILITISTILILALIGCGDGSSKEAQERLQRILTLIGIPPSIIINICQDNNNNSFCENSEILAKITIARGDTLDKIWEKIQFDASNSYWLDNLDPDKKILLVMQDRDNIEHDNGKFTLPFTINLSKENNSTKELSILEAMVDANYLTPLEVLAVKKMDSVDKFYDALLKDLMKNFNTLKDKNLDSSLSILENLKYMAEELREKGINQKLPNRVNACGGDEKCVNSIINEVFKDLEITDSEADSIANLPKEEESSEDREENTPPVQIEEKQLLLTKETSYGEDGAVENVAIYEYDSNNKMIRSKNTYGSTFSSYEDICTLSYDSQNRYTGNTCIETTNNVNGQPTESRTRDEVHYANNKFIGTEYYTDSKLDHKEEVLDWYGDNKPREIKMTSYDSNNNRTESTWTVNYTKNNPTHVTLKTEHTTHEMSRKFDDKKTPYNFVELFKSGYVSWLVGENNIVNETWISTSNISTQNFTTNIDKRYEIIYNSDNIPTRIDEYTTTTNSSNSSQEFKTHSYNTYEYREN